MSNANQLTEAQEARAAALREKFDRLGDSGQGEILAEILEATNEVTFALDRGRAADTRDLERLLGAVDDFLSTVLAAFLGILVEAEETWGGIEHAPEDYYSVYLDLRSLRREAEVLRKDALALCSGLPKVS